MEANLRLKRGNYDVNFGIDTDFKRKEVTEMIDDFLESENALKLHHHTYEHLNWL